jgi:hypothetical protein
MSEYSFYILCGGNIALFVLSIVFGNKIYNRHKDEIPTTVGDENEDGSDEELSEDGD